MSLTAGVGGDPVDLPAGDNADSYVVLGRVVGAYGVRGWLRIQAFGDDPLSWRAMGDWWLSSPRDGATAEPAAANWQAYPLVQCRLQGANLVAQLAGIADRDSAEALKGCLLGAPRSELPDPGQDAYYWGDLIGMAVFGSGGLPLGVVSRLLETGANDVLVVVDADGKERLLPFVEAVIERVDGVGRRIDADWEADW